MMDGRVALVLDGGACSGGGATTVDVTEPLWKLIKQGGIEEKQIGRVPAGPGLGADHPAPVTISLCLKSSRFAIACLISLNASAQKKARHHRSHHGDAYRPSNRDPSIGLRTPALGLRARQENLDLRRAIGDQAAARKLPRPRSQGRENAITGSLRLAKPPRQ